MSMDPQPLHWLAAACGVTLDPSPGTTMVRRMAAQGSTPLLPILMKLLLPPPLP